MYLNSCFLKTFGFSKAWNTFPPPNIHISHTTNTYKIENNGLYGLNVEVKAWLIATNSVLSRILLKNIKVYRLLTDNFQIKKGSVDGTIKVNESIVFVWKPKKNLS